MRPLTILLSVEEALDILLRQIQPITDTEEIAIEKACGRVMAESVAAGMDVPPFDRAAMDGYAVVAASTAGASEQAPVTLHCQEYLYAGSLARKRVSADTCAEIATGAPLPPGADAVVMVERTSKDGDAIHIQAEVAPGTHITRRGADMRDGETAIAEGTLLTPARVGALAAIGCRTARVYRRPRVKIGATGNEVIEPGTPIQPGQIYDINSYSLYALADSLGCDAELLPAARDDVQEIKQRVQQSLDADLIILSGGSSVGEKDVLQDVLGEMGEILFHGVAIKPGKPTMLARVHNKPVLGMPGYPTSCLSNGYMFVAPVLAKLARRTAQRATIRVRAAETMRSLADKYQVLTVRLTDSGAAAAFKESGVITSMSRADGFIQIPLGVDRVEAGQEVEVTLL